MKDSDLHLVGFESTVSANWTNKALLVLVRGLEPPKLRFLRPQAVPFATKSHEHELVLPQGIEPQSPANQAGALPLNDGSI